MVRLLARAGMTFLLLLAAFGPATAHPRRVLLLHSFGPHFVPWKFFSGHFREKLMKASAEPIQLYEASLEITRYAELENQQSFVDYLHNLYAGQDIELIVTMGAPAARFAQRYRREFFPSTPLLIAAPEKRVINEAALTANDAVVTVTLDFSKWIEHILQMLPSTTHIAWAVGASRLERSWTEEFRRSSAQFADRVAFEWFNDLSFEAMLGRAAALPRNSAIMFVDVRVDALGVTLDTDSVLPRLRAATSAPIFSYVEDFLGRGIVGGPLLSSEELGRRIAAAALRILKGEPPRSIEIPSLTQGAPRYDWRELERWNIGEARLPPGSIVQFREPTAWERYRSQLIGIILTLLCAAGIISWLLVERRARRTAELKARARFLEVMHLNRTAEVGALSASFAHELSQPLEAVTLNVDTTERLLGANPPELARAKEALVDIRQANKHATEIIQRLKTLLKREGEVRQQEFDLNGAIADALRLLSPEAARRSVTLHTNGVHQPLSVNADRIHVQQVILNLAANAMDAMTDTPPHARAITIQTALAGVSEVEVSISDSGTGIPKHKLGQVFDTFYTTKTHGTGLGLSIARTIVENYGGKIRVENRIEGGAVFRFTLPLLRSA
jgi:signal transduction histidine kinase